MPYVDGFLLPVPKKNLNAYRSMSEKAGKIWKDHGALEYRECAGDDLDVKMGVSFKKIIKLKPGETVVFCMDCLQVPRPPRQSQRQGDERPANGYECQRKCRST